MASLIIRKEEYLPEEVKNLTGKNFNPAQHPEIIYIPGSINAESLAKIPYYMCAVLSSLTGIFFLYTCISAIIYWSRYGAFRNEGPFISFIMFAFMSGLFLLCRRYLKKSKKMQQQIANGEIRFGFWITPTHMICHDMNEGWNCVLKADIASVEIYKSVRPPLDMVVLHLHNKQQMRIVANWLNGYYKKVEDLKILIESKLFSGKIKPGVIDDFIRQHSIPNEMNNRFELLIIFAERYNKDHNLTGREKQELITYLNKKIEAWPAEERLAKEDWWVDFNIDDSYAYGVNMAGIKEFRGYYKNPNWLMPLAKTAILDFDMADLIAEKNADSFVEANSFEGLEALILKITVCDYCIEKIMASGKFSHLKKLVTPGLNTFDPNMRKKFEDWKTEHKIKSA